ncbi:MAG: hypothetical protein ACI87E_000278 [Mariniblastus sp.]
MRIIPIVYRQHSLLSTTFSLRLTMEIFNPKPRTPTPRRQGVSNCSSFIVAVVLIVCGVGGTGIAFPKTQDTVNSSNALAKLNLQPNPIESVPKNNQQIMPDVPGPRPSKDSHWIPGYLAWNPSDLDFVWIDGHWKSLPANTRWVAGYWKDSPTGFNWVNGFLKDDRAQIARPTYQFNNQRASGSTGNFSPNRSIGQTSPSPSTSVDRAASPADRRPARNLQVEQKLRRGESVDSDYGLASNLTFSQSQANQRAYDQARRREEQRLATQLNRSNFQRLKPRTDSTNSYDRNRNLQIDATELSARRQRNEVARAREERVRTEQLKLSTEQARLQTQRAETQRNREDFARAKSQKERQAEMAARQAQERTQREQRERAQEQQRRTDQANHEQAQRAQREQVQRDQQRRMAEQQRQQVQDARRDRRDKKN